MKKNSVLTRKVRRPTFAQGKSYSSCRTLLTSYECTTQTDHLGKETIQMLIIITSYHLAYFTVY